VRSGKKTGFLAGADLREFAAIQDPAEAAATSRRGQGVYNRLAALKAPTVAVVHGACLGGGLELALACDYRLVFDRPDTTLGLPEIELGLLPGWGGTMRLPRVVGLEHALQIILAGKRLNAREALAWGLADAVAADEPTLREEVARLLVRATWAGKRDRTALPVRTWRQRFLEGNWLGRGLLLKGTERMVRNKTPDDMPAPLEAFEAVRAGVNDGASAGLRREAEAAGRLAVTPACRNLIGLFFQREAAKKLPAWAGDPRPVRKVGVVGAGVMGAGIAQLAALAGREVIVREVDEKAVAAGNARIDALFAKLVERKRATAQHAARCRAAIKVSTTYHDFNHADLVVEAAVEDAALKRALFAELAGKTRAILATNTSSLTVASLAGVPDPGRVAGLHFFNPVHKMPLVEVVRHAGTSDETAGRLMKFVLDLGKTPAAVGDGPGFVVNAVLMPYLEEAVILLSEGLRTAAIDRLMRRFGMPVGPLELLDQIGLDVAAHVAASLGQAGVAAAVFEKMREQGRLGEKGGTGFYRHGKKPAPDPAAEALAASLGTPGAKLPAAALAAEARERLVLRMVNEAARLADAGRADADTVDLAMVLGTGWAPHRGGPLRYADLRGLADVRAALEALAGRLGPRFTPADGLSRRERFRPES
ncbi:MAG: 3-hydroxyacyl-CoA dehydrogenase NAD-binding domain-containing protein, partial [Gemmataceae bacterium]